MTAEAAIETPSWIRDLNFVAAVALPEDWAEEFGTTVNGMWEDPSRWTPDAIAVAHDKGQRILVSMPLIALTHRVYERDAFAYLKDEVCRDIDGGLAEVEWYYWDSQPVYALCIHSPVVHSYLVDSLRPAIAAGVDVVNADEIQTNVGLMTRRPKGSGFCHRCLAGSATLAEAARIRKSAQPTDDELRSWLRDDPELYQRFLTEQQDAAFRAVQNLFDDLRKVALDAGQVVAITANVTGLGSFAGSNGQLWTAAWGELVDVIVLEAIYVVAQSQFHDPDAHKLLPRGTFAPLYRLGHAIGPRAPIWITPQINVPRQLAGQPRQRYYEMMFLEAYANRGRWGYYWWPGVDALTRREATAPEAIKTWTAFMRAHRDLYADVATANSIAIIYSNAAILAEPSTHDRYLALAQALYEGGVQYDVIYTGDERFVAADLDDSELDRYRLIVIPGIDGLTPSQAGAVERYRAQGGLTIGIAASSREGERLDRFWADYGDTDRRTIIETCHIEDAERIIPSSPRVVATRYVAGGATVVHVLNYDYVAHSDEVAPANDLVLRLAWKGGVPAARLLSPVDERTLNARLDGQWLEVEVPILRDHAVVELVQPAR